MEFTPHFFDEASKAWRENKVRIGEGHYRYKNNAFNEKITQSKELKEVKESKLRRSPRFTASK
jgi:hypothetical protein